MSHIHPRYQQSIDRVIHHIYESLAATEPAGLTLDELSAVSGFSKFHFHRLFAACVGMNINTFVQRLRLKKASYQLVFFPQMPIIDIALDAGFESHEAFSRAFKRTYQITPSQFRKQPDWSAWSEQHNYYLNKPYPMEVNICQFPETLVAALPHHGDHRLINQTVARFIEWRKQTNESPVNNSQTYGLAYSDPASSEPFRFDVCSTVQRPVSNNSFGVVTQVIPAGRCARVTHQGSHDLMDEKIRYLYNQWVIEQEQQLRDFPCFFHYRNLFPQVAESELVTDIYLPLL
ncbi:GyrI-like domain-containing protein [Marinicella sediminis]|uniref:GyrI-like domain-containing protein n=1 Tax=Marinicella sediminis TaxID=1792834 RepID=A0ABV7JFX6_9GAMM|nr:AraC family transcriptional regulator [Marinicella sediminis]